ncbi:MAG: addiction module protein [Isosphaeraceae bacterium]|nr:addiction module protein [Isosphaeraceae bacterium]
MDLQDVLMEVREWSAEDRLRLIEEVWDDLSGESPRLPLTAELKDLLDRRIAALEADPENVESWEEIKTFVRRPR